MKDLRHIKRFNESDENLNISDVRNSNKKILKIDSIIEYYEKEIRQLKSKFKEHQDDLDPVNDVISDKISLISGFIVRLTMLKDIDK